MNFVMLEAMLKTVDISLMRTVTVLIHMHKVVKKSLAGVCAKNVHRSLSRMSPGATANPLGHRRTQKDFHTSTPAEDGDYAAKTRAVYRRDVTSKILEHWFPSTVTLPSVRELSRFLDAPLHEDAKIPLTQDQFDSFLSVLQVNDILEQKDIQQIFRVDDREHSECLYILFGQALRNNPPPHDSTRNAFISFWDANIRRIVDFLIPGTSIRDDSPMSIAGQKPGFGFLYDRVCPFRGEEEASICDWNYSRIDAKLTGNMTWTYDPAPYVLGYYARGTVMSLVAICRPSYPQQPLQPEVVYLQKVDLGLKINRLQNLIRMVRLCSLIKPVTASIGLRITAEFVPLKNVENRFKVVELCGKDIKRTFKGPGHYSKLQQLKRVYSLLKAKAVPNVDSLSASFVDVTHGAVAYTEPKGICVVPTNTREAFEAVRCVLEALVVMHQGPKPIFHRDIRWTNIIRRADDPTRWFLIDWDKASTTPTFAEPNYYWQGCYAPTVFLDNHGPEVDVWAVGMLLIEYSEESLAFPSDFRVLGEAMQSGKLSAVESLERFKDLEPIAADHF